MDNVINFQAAVNARRVAAEVNARLEAQRQRVANEKERLADKLGGSIGAQIVADVVVDHAEERREIENAGRYVPAYCDPTNEFRGAKYEATRSLDVKEIAKRMREDIKALKLRDGFKVGVAIQRFSGGQSIDVRVKEVPADFKFWSEKRVSWFKQFDDRRHCPCSTEDAQSPEYSRIKAALEQIHNSYNRDNSDSMTDYFCVKYYGSVNFEGAWAALKREAEEYDGQYWADDCCP